MTPIIKLIFALCCLELAHCLSPPQDISGRAKKYCENQGQDCEAAARRCIKYVAPTEQEKDEIRSMFNKCLKDLQLEQNYTAFLNGQTEDPSQRGLKYKSFVSFLDQNGQQSDSTKLRCCFGQTSKMIGKDLNFDKQVLRDKINEKGIDDKAVYNAFMGAIDTCNTVLVDCRGDEYIKCSMNTCIKAIRGQ